MARRLSLGSFAATATPNRRNLNFQVASSLPRPFHPPYLAKLTRAGASPNTS
jgi:hypothetical protein